jgi:hypothetical protein
MYPIKSSDTTLCGRGLQHRRLRASQKAALAAMLFNKEITLKPSVCQATALTGANIAYVNAARRLSPLMRRLIADGRNPLLFAAQLKALPAPRAADGQTGAIHQVA